jgi:hypothetical protein
MLSTVPSIVPLHCFKLFKGLAEFNLKNFFVLITVNVNKGTGKDISDGLLVMLQAGKMISWLPICEITRNIIAFFNTSKNPKQTE